MVELLQSNTMRFVDLFSDVVDELLKARVLRLVWPRVIYVSTALCNRR